MKTTYKYLNYKNYSDITIYNITKMEYLKNNGVADVKKTLSKFQNFSTAFFIILFSQQIIYETNVSFYRVHYHNNQNRSHIRNRSHNHNCKYHNHNDTHNVLGNEYH